MVQTKENENSKDAQSERKHRFLAKHPGEAALVRDLALAESVDSASHFTRASNRQASLSCLVQNTNVIRVASRRRFFFFGFDERTDGVELVENSVMKAGEQSTSNGIRRNATVYFQL